MGAGRMTTILSFFATIFIVVAVHEWGHYIAAKMFGVRVLRFSVGFGKPLFSWTDKAGTEWALAPIPLGGYVRMLDEESAKEKGADASETMEAQPNWRRFIIYAAGPLANFLLAAAIFAGVLYVNGEEQPAPLIGYVRPESPAARAGLRKGDMIESVDGAPVVLWNQAEKMILDVVRPGGTVQIVANGKEYELSAGEEISDDISSVWALELLGLEPDESYFLRSVGEISPDSAAEEAGLRVGDEIVAIDGVVLESWRQLAFEVIKKPDKLVTMVLWRSSDSVTASAVTVSVRLKHKINDYGVPLGVLGIRPQFSVDNFIALQATLRYGLFDSIVRGIKESGEVAVRTFSAIASIISGSLSFSKNVSGPVGIAQGAGDAADSGAGTWWRFVGFISVSLGMINLLPIPLLDGGQMVVCMVQGALRRRLPDSVLSWMNRAGAIFLIMLMAFVILLDIVKLI